jgi:hypothetical protein
MSIHNQQFVEAVQSRQDHLDPQWITVKFLDAGTPFTFIHYELWDEDTTSGNEHLDIEPRNGVTNLDFSYIVATQHANRIGIARVYAGPDNLLVRRRTPGNHAGVKLGIETRTFGPAPRDLSPFTNPDKSIGATIDSNSNEQLHVCGTLAL